MENTDNLRILADTAYESGSFEQAHQYYTRLVEADLSDSRAWLGKGLSAGGASEPPKPKFEELIVSIKQAFKNGMSHDEDKSIADSVTGYGQAYLKVSLSQYIQSIPPSGNNTDTNLHNRKMSAVKYGKAQDVGLMSATKAMEFACDIDTSLPRLSQTIADLDLLINHSNQNFEYLGSRNEAQSNISALMQRRQRLLTKVKSIKPEFIPQTVANSGNDDVKCFIATATLGDYNHPYVLDLRNYRDSVLLPTAMGRAAVKSYYKLSPPLADFIGKRPLLRVLSLRLLIKPAVRLVRRRHT